MTKPMNLNEINEEMLSFGDIKTLDNGGKICFVNYGEGDSTSNLVTQTGLQDLPWDMNTFDNPDGTKSYSLSMSFKNRDTNPSTKNFFEGCEKLDHIMLNHGVENQMEWLKKRGKTAEQLAEDYYTPNVRWAKDKETGEVNPEYPPRFQLKLVQRNGKWAFNVYNENRELVNLDETPLESLLVRGAKVKALIKLTTVWTGSKGFGCKWAVVQLKIHRTQQYNNYAFNDDDDEDEEEPALGRSESTVLTQESEPENEDYLEEEVKVEAPPVKKKKRIVRKKTTE